MPPLSELVQPAERLTQEKHVVFNAGTPAMRSIRYWAIMSGGTTAHPASRISRGSRRLTYQRGKLKKEDTCSVGPRLRNCLSAHRREIWIRRTVCDIHSVHTCLHVGLGRAGAGTGWSRDTPQPVSHGGHCRP